MTITKLDFKMVMSEMCCLVGTDIFAKDSVYNKHATTRRII